MPTPSEATAALQAKINALEPKDRALLQVVANAILAGAALYGEIGEMALVVAVSSHIEALRALDPVQLSSVGALTLAANTPVTA